MAEQTAIEQATKRLMDALDALDAAVERRIESDRERAALPTRHAQARENPGIT